MIMPYNIGIYSGFTSLHYDSIILSLFSGLVSPLSGFMASGFKRAIKIKDFSNLIPGHGGVTDRMDCQVFMGSFIYVWINSMTIYCRSNTLHSLYFILEEQSLSVELNSVVNHLVSQLHSN